MSTDPLTRVAQQRHLIARLGLAVAFEALLILALLVFFLANRRYETRGAESAAPGKIDEIVKAKPVPYVPAPGGPDGKQIFESRCNSCHRPDGERSVGPGLAGAPDRVPKDGWLYKWVRDPKKMLDAKDPYATKIFAEYKTEMTAQPLSDEEIDAVFRYVDAYNGKR